MALSKIVGVRRDGTKVTCYASITSSDKGYDPLIVSGYAKGYKSNSSDEWVGFVYTGSSLSSGTILDTIPVSSGLSTIDLDYIDIDESGGRYRIVVHTYGTEDLFTPVERFDLTFGVDIGPNFGPGAVIPTIRFCHSSKTFITISEGSEALICPLINERGETGKALAIRVTSGSDLELFVKDIGPEESEPTIGYSIEEDFQIGAIDANQNALSALRLANQASKDAKQALLITEKLNGNITNYYVSR